MPGFFDNIPIETAKDAEAMSALAYSLRCDRKAVLERHGFTDAGQLLSAIRNGSVPEHPAYEDYLAASALLAAHEAARESLRILLAETKLT
jgi:hypothetical protein